MKKLFPFLLFLTIFLSCNDDDMTTPINQLPPATMTGENTFGCLINLACVKYAQLTDN